MKFLSISCACIIRLLSTTIKNHSSLRITLKVYLQIQYTPLAYELRVLDDDDEEDYYVPLYEIAALERTKTIGEFGIDSVAFCRAKKFKKENSKKKSTNRRMPC
jgi:hypothetical protein